MRQRDEARLRELAPPVARGSQDAGSRNLPPVVYLTSVRGRGHTRSIIMKAALSEGVATQEAE